MEYNFSDIQDSISKISTEEHFLISTALYLGVFYIFRKCHLKDKARFVLLLNKMFITTEQDFLRDLKLPLFSNCKNILHAVISTDIHEVKSVKNLRMSKSMTI